MMELAGIDKSVVTNYWDLPGPHADAYTTLIAALKSHGHKLVGFLRVNPNYEAEAIDFFERAVKEDGIRGLKLSGATCPISPYSAPVRNLVGKAAELGAPVFFHSGDDPLTLPQQIGVLARKSPRAHIILGHMGGYFYVRDAIRLVKKLPNLYLETSVMPYPKMIKEAVKTLGPERVFFGSDSPGVHPVLELNKVRAAGLRPTELESVLGLSFENFLRRQD